MFTEAGTFRVEIIDAKIAEPRFATGPNDFDIAIQVARVDDPAQTDWWLGEMSMNYGKGAVAHMTQAQLTGQTLRKIGFEGDDLTELGTLIGKTTAATVKESEKDGTKYYNVRSLGSSGREPTPLDQNEAQRRMQALMAEAEGEGGPAAETDAPAAPPAAAAPNPFAKPAEAAPAKAAPTKTAPAQSKPKKSAFPF